MSFFLRLGALRLSSLMLAVLAGASALPGVEVHVSVDGDDHGSGSAGKPVRTLAAAQMLARAARLSAPAERITVVLGKGVYYLPETLEFDERDSGSAAAPTVYTAAEHEDVVLSGGMRLQLAWKPYRDGIMQAQVPHGTSFDQLFVAGKRQSMARFPNYDPTIARYNGYSGEAISPERVARWRDPAGGFIHALHGAEWGGYSYRITGKAPDGQLQYEGGWQNNRPSGMHTTYRMVENIFEELDAPGEWFLDGKKDVLYYFPLPGADLAHDLIEGARLRSVIEMRGTREHPVRFVSVAHMTIRHATRTFMDNKEPLLRGDWTCYRGGSVFIEGAEDCVINGCWFDQVGGNALFISRYARHVSVTGCHIEEPGGNGVAVVGDPKAVRNALLNYGNTKNISEIDRTPGPQTEDYPRDCLIDDCLIHGCGRYEKQTAPIDIDMAMRITVRDGSLYDTPRAGLNIGDGCWGGHVIEGCDIFDTVLETGDNGSFNSWGRDRYWNLGGVDLNAIVGTANADLPLLDVVEPITLRHNRWRCDHGWDIDLDDGSSNYHIINNLCLNGGLKLREGFHRVAENNVIVGNSLHTHVWFRDSEDILRHNIVCGQYAPIGMTAPWGKECDYNFMHQNGSATAPAATLQGQSGRDAHSLQGDAHFIDPAHGDYRVAPDSPALALGFVNFPMDHFGVRSPALRALARQPRLPGQAAPEPAEKTMRDELVSEWLGAHIKNLVGLGEVSATGSAGETGVLIKEVADGSIAQAAGLHALDVIRSIDGHQISTVSDLLRSYGKSPSGQALAVGLWRAQHEAMATLPGDHTIYLTPSTASMRGEGGKPAYDGGAEYLGAWTNERIDVAWESTAIPAGIYDVSVLVAAPREDSGATFALHFGDQTLTGKVPPTGDWNRFSAVYLGKVTIAAAAHTDVVLHPLTKPGLAVMNLRAVVLTVR